MVVSKRCKICTIIDTNNVSISGEYFGKLIPDLIASTCGIELDSHKANGVLICQLCIIQLVQADMVIQKIRNGVQRLKKNVKAKKPTGFNKTAIENSDQQLDKGTLCEQSFKDPEKILNEAGSKSPKKFKRRESVYREKVPDNNCTGNNSIDQAINSTNIKFSKILDNIPKQSTPVNTLKRKPPSSPVINNINDPTSTPSNKSLPESVSEDYPMNLTVDELDGNSSGANEKKVKAKNCILCGKLFHSNSELRTHIETGHMGERLKSCPHCSSEFRSKQKFESHIYSEKCKNTTQACQYPKCNKRFKTIHKMELHMQEKHLFHTESDRA